MNKCRFNCVGRFQFSAEQSPIFARHWRIFSIRLQRLSPSINQFLERYAQNELLHVFEGEITEPILNETLQKIEAQLENTEEDGKKSRKVYNILVEQLQNLYHHTDAAAREVLDNGDSKKTAFFALAKKNDEYRLLSANYIVRNNIEKLKARLDKINNLDKDGLRDYYKEVLDNGQYSVHGGGGLGMIDIARKSGNKLDYEFCDVNSDYGMFVLEIKV